MAKYVKLTADHTQWDSALYASLPRPLRAVSPSAYNDYHWFEVEEHYEYRSDAELFRYVRQAWTLEADGKVHINYTAEMVQLEDRRRIMSDRVTKVRNQKLRDSLTFKGFIFDTREETYIRVTGTVLNASMDATFTTAWVTEDNTVVVLSNQDILDLGQAFSKFETDHIMFARQLKDEIEASLTPETAIIADAAWPVTEYFATGTLTVA